MTFADLAVVLEGLGWSAVPNLGFAEYRSPGGDAAIAWEPSDELEPDAPRVVVAFRETFGSGERVSPAQASVWARRRAR